MPTRFLLMCMLLSMLLSMSPAVADAVSDLERTARATFDNLPQVVRVSDLSKRCEGDEDSNPIVRYCSSEDKIYIDMDIATKPEASYYLGHAYGHAVQVKHGVADVALAKITANRDREDELRGMVTRQVECIAGVLIARSGLPLPQLSAQFSKEPFTGSHWGRTPMRGGPKVSIGLSARETWLSRGFHSKSFQSCANGEMGAVLLLKAEKP